MKTKTTLGDHGIISSTRHHGYTIERRANGFRVVHTERGTSSGTFATFQKAMDDIRTMEYQAALVKNYGTEGAIAVLRGDSSSTQSAQ